MLSAMTPRKASCVKFTLVDLCISWVDVVMRGLIMLAHAV